MTSMLAARGERDFIIDHVRRVGSCLLKSKWVNVRALEQGPVQILVELPTMDAVLEMLTEISALRAMVLEDQRARAQDSGPRVVYDRASEPPR